MDPTEVLGGIRSETVKLSVITDDGEIVWNGVGIRLKD